MGDMATRKLRPPEDRFLVLAKRRKTTTMLATARISSCCSMLTVVIVATSARGDLYTDGVLSLELLVDYSDEIHHVRFAPAEAGGSRVAELHRTLKPLTADSVPGEDEILRMVAPQLAKQDEEWLLFVRQIGGIRNTVHKVNLSQPMAFYQRAAINRKGEPIRDRESILKAVDARVQLRRSMPAGCLGIPLTDESYWSDDSWWPPVRGQVPFERHIGYARIKISCDYWDQGGPHDADTSLIYAVVPIEPKDHVPLLESARLGDKYTGSPKYFHPVHSLVNFPDKQTQDLLREMARDSQIYRSRSYRRRANMARSVLRYQHYRMAITDPLNLRLVGAWRLEGQRERIHLKLAKDNTFTTTTYDYRQHPYTPENPRFIWRDKGYWVVRDGRLSLMRSHSGIPGAWSRNVREIFRDKKIRKATSTEVVLEGGPPMKRDE